MSDWLIIVTLVVIAVLYIAIQAKK